MHCLARRRHQSRALPQHQGRTPGGPRGIIAAIAGQAALDDDPTAHVLRYTFATSLEGKTDLVVVAELMGHSRLDTTRALQLAPRRSNVSGPPCLVKLVSGADTAGGWLKSSPLARRASPGRCTKRPTPPHRCPDRRGMASPVRPSTATLPSCPPPLTASERPPNTKRDQAMTPGREISRPPRGRGGAPAALPREIRSRGRTSHRRPPKRMARPHPLGRARR